MYCICCGVELSEGQELCPICHTRVCHPDFPVDRSRAPYPAYSIPAEEINYRGLLFAITVCVALAAVLPVLFEFLFAESIGWSGYAAGGILLGYLVLVFPFWFRNANPVILVPCDFAAAILYLLYINLHTGGDWFLSFAFPGVGILGLLTTALVVLTRYIRKGRLYMFGGWLIGLGLWSVLLEFFLWLTFDKKAIISWSVFPLVTLVAFGLFLITVGIVKPLKESLRKIFFY